MAVTVYEKAPGQKVFEGGNLKAKFVSIDLGAYATDGVAITASKFGMDAILAIFFQAPHTTNIKYVKFDVANMKILAYSDVGATQVVNTTDLAGQRVHALVIGR